MMGKKAGGDKWTRIIGLFKLLKGVLLAALAIGLLKLFHKDLEESVKGWIQRLNMDPNNHLFQRVIGKLGGLDSHKLLLYTLGTWFYSALFLTEGIGLLLLKRWA